MSHGTMVRRLTHTGCLPSRASSLKSFNVTGTRVSCTHGCEKLARSWIDCRSVKGDLVREKLALLAGYC